MARNKNQIDLFANIKEPLKEVKNDIKLKGLIKKTEKQRSFIFKDNIGFICYYEITISFKRSETKLKILNKNDGKNLIQNKEFLNRIKRDFSAKFNKIEYKIININFIKVIDTNGKGIKKFSRL